MKTNRAQCRACFLKGGLALSGRLGVPVESQEHLRHFLDETFATLDERQPPPFIARDMYRKINEYSGISDPFQEEKRLSTEYAWNLLESLRQQIADFPDPFEGRVRLALAGNIIDFGTNVNFSLESAHEQMMRVFSEPLDSVRVSSLKKAMEDAPSILYLLDNCGEAVFDRFFMEPYREKTTICVRGGPVLNDITREELADSGLDDFARKVIDTGDTTPGISLPHSSPEFLAEFSTASLIIAKGQGNFETLVGMTSRPIFYLFRAKCPVVIAELGNVEPLSLQIVPEHIGKEQKNASPHP